MQMRQGLEQAPPEVADCLKSTVGEEVFTKLQSGGLPPRDLGEKMQACFESFRPRPPGAFREDGPSQGNFQGPRPSGEGGQSGDEGFGGPPQGQFGGPVTGLGVVGG